MKQIAIVAMAASLVSAPAIAAEATAPVSDTEGSELGTVVIRDTPSGMTTVTIELHDLPEGQHAIHLHETGDCSAADFSSAGGHIAGDHSHGVMNAEGPHPGDMPNVTILPDGLLNSEVFLANLPVDEMMDDDGAAFVMHGGTDDYESQPSGDAGDRIACGVFEAGE